MKPLKETINGDFADDPILVEIDKHCRALLSLMSENPKYAFALYAAKKLDDGNTSTYSALCGQSQLIADSIYVDLETQLEDGDSVLFDMFFDVILALYQETDNDEEEISNGKVLH